MKLVDAHCHLDSALFDGDREAVLERARDAGVHGFVVPGVHPGRWRTVKETAEAIPGACCALGIHPVALPELAKPQLEEAIERLAWDLRGAKAAALGECGLDQFVAKRHGISIPEQALVFDVQLEIARALELPLVLHVVGAHGEALRRLQHYGPFPAGGMVHSYSGPAELVPRYLAMNLSFGFGCAITRQGVRRPLEALATIPDERLLIETDSPDQSPDQSRNEPANLVKVLEVAAKVRKVSVEKLARTTTTNASVLFGIDV